jgi:hypothetical protein
VTDATWIACIALADLICSWKFVPLYFRIGIPVFWRKIGGLPDGNEVITAEMLEWQMPDSAWPAFSFQEIGANEFGFRERFFSGRLKYTPFMHGTLTLDPTLGRAAVVGRVNWFPLALIAFAFFGLPDSSDIQFGVALLLIVGIIYAIQVVRYSQVAVAAETLLPSPTGVDIDLGDPRQSLQPRTPPSKIRADRIPTTLIVAVGTALVIGFLAAFGVRADPYRDLSSAFPSTSSAPKTKALSPPAIRLYTASSRKSSRHRASMDIALSAEAVELVPTFPSNLFFRRVVIPIADVSGCGKTNWGNGVLDALILVGRTSTEISIENSPAANTVFRWCNDNRVPMVSERELRDWEYKGVPLPDRTKLNEGQ